MRFRLVTLRFRPVTLRFRPVVYRLRLVEAGPVRKLKAKGKNNRLPKKLITGLSNGAGRGILSGASLRLRGLLFMESDSGFRLGFFRHQLPDSVKDHPELRIVFLL